MGASQTSRFEPFEARTPTLFLAAGGLFVVFAAILGADAFTSVTARTAEDVFGPAGWTVSFVGLLGLYPRIVDRSPRLARAGAVFAAVGTAGASATAAANLAQIAGIVGEPPARFAALQLLIFVGIIPGFISFAAAVLRTRIYSRTVGLLLLVPAAIFVVNIVRVAALGPRVPTGGPFVLGAGQAVTLLALGYSLRTESAPSDGAEPTTEATA